MCEQYLSSDRINNVPRHFDTFKFKDELDISLQGLMSKQNVLESTCDNLLLFIT